jgi:hypothetical protein
MVSKPREPSPKFSPHKWGLTVEGAFAQIEAAVRSLDFAEDDINEGLRNERLKSGEWQISPNSVGTWRPLNSSDWAQRTVRAKHSVLGPGMTTPPVGLFRAPRRGEGSVYIEGPGFAGHVFICRADLDKYYSTPTTGERPAPTTAGGHRIDDDEPRRKPGPKPRDDWPMLLAAKLIDVALNEPENLKNVDGLVQYMRGTFLPKQIDWAPADKEAVRKMIVQLLQFVRR